MYVVNVIVVILLICVHVCIGQKQTEVIPCSKVEDAKDCITALTINPRIKYHFSCTPTGNGLELDITENDKFYSFEEEHNMIWLKFDQPFDAYVSFDLIPKDSTYDYDFMLFKVGAEALCIEDMQNVLPLRSNISRNDVFQKSITGLRATAKDTLVGAGKNPLFSKSFFAKKGDQYYLAIDNFTGGYKGFFLEFTHHISKTIVGEVINTNTNKGIMAKVSLEEIETGRVLKNVKSNQANGKYEVTGLLDLSMHYRIVAEAKGYFFSENTISEDYTVAKAKIAKVEKGLSVDLHGINFYGDSFEFLPEALPSLHRLKILMLENPNANIRIDGHTNGCNAGVDVAQDLSESRASMVKSYLVQGGIKAPRIQTKGCNCTKMLYPDMKSEWEKQHNRRVEITIQ